MIEYAAIIAAISAIQLSSLTSFEPSMNVFLTVGGFIFVLWLVVFKY
jgi:hypothetical protein